MTIRLDGARVVVTGGASGIGLAAVRSLRTAGARVAILDVQEEALAAAATEFEGTGTHTARVDVSAENEVDTAFSHIEASWGPIESVIHAAGIVEGASTDIRDVSLDAWDRVLRVPYLSG